MDDRIKRSSRYSNIVEYRPARLKDGRAIILGIDEMIIGGPLAEYVATHNPRWVANMDAAVIEDCPDVIYLTCKLF